MSITVTSFTNMVAFGIGMTTVMPFLKSFCIFAATGILFLYVYEIMFFISCLVYDERRLAAKKDGCCCRPQPPDWRANECSRRDFQRILFEKYVAPCVTKTWVKTIVLLTTVGLLCVNVWAIFQVEQSFDPLMYLNQESYPIRFNNKLKEHFPRYGKYVNIYLTGVDYYEDRQTLAQLVDALRRNPYINNRTLDPWFVAYEKWLNTTGKGNTREDRKGDRGSENLEFDLLVFVFALCALRRIPTCNPRSLISSLRYLADIGEIRTHAECTSY